MVLSSFLFSVADILNMIVSLYIWVLIIHVVMSWIHVSPYNQFAQTINRLSEPAYKLLHKIIPNTVFNGIDVAPLILILGLRLINDFVMRILANLA